MTDMSKKREEVKKNIRSLLISAGPKMSLPSRQLCRDYHGLLGTPIPFRDLGYCSAEDFFQDIPDILRTRWAGSDMMLEAVPDDTTLHIAKMVSRQKPKKSTRGGSRNVGSGRLYGRTSYGQGAPRFSRNPSSAPKPEPPSVQTILRGKLFSFFLNYPRRIPLVEFERAYSRWTNSDLDFRRLGFKSLESFLRAVPDIVQLDETKHGLIVSGKGKTSGENIPRLTGAGDGRPPKRHTDNNDRDNRHHQAEIPEFDSSGISRKLREAIQKVLERKPDGIWASSFPAEFRKVTGKDLPFKTLGYLSVIELLSALDTVKIERPCQRDWLLFDSITYSKKSAGEKREVTRPKKSEDLTMKSPMMSTAPPIPPELKETIHQVVLWSAEGIVMGNLPRRFEEATGHSLPVKDLGFATLEDLLMQLSDITDLKYCGQGTVKVLPVNPDATRRPELVPNLVPIPQKDVPSKSSLNLPEDVVGLGNAYTFQTVHTDGPFFEVCVSNINSPGDFWLQLNGENTVTALEDLMDLLESTYYNEAISSRYVIPPELIQEGLICVAIFPEDENWHRVTIVSTANFARLSMVKVYFADYGNTCEVHKDALRLLRRRYLKLPAQAIKARLALIKPKNGHTWTEASKNRMLKLVANRTVIASSIDVDGTQSDCLNVFLCDTSKDEDIHINDVLVNEGYAIEDGPAVSKTSQEASPDSSDSNMPGLVDDTIADLKTLDTEDQTWSGSSEDEDDSESCESSMQLDLSDLQTAQIALQFKRKHILQNMMKLENPESSMTQVEELQMVEQQLATVRERIQEFLEQQLSGSEEGTPKKKHEGSLNASSLNPGENQHVRASQVVNPAPKSTQADVSPCDEPMPLKKQTNIVSPCPADLMGPFVPTQPGLAGMMSSLNLGGGVMPNLGQMSQQGMGQIGQHGLGQMVQPDLGQMGQQGQGQMGQPGLGQMCQPYPIHTQQQLMAHYQQLLRQAAALPVPNAMMQPQPLIQSPLMLNPLMANAMFMPQPGMPGGLVTTQAPTMQMDMSALMSSMAAPQGGGRGMMYPNLGQIPRPGSS